MGTSVLVEKKGNVSIIRLNEPDKMNSLSSALRADLMTALVKFKEDQASRVAVLTGQGNAFCAGGDLAELATGISAVHGVEHMTCCNEITLLITGIPKPIIAAVNGAAAGAGFSIAMACDLVLASSGASFMPAFAKVGLVPDMGSLYLLPRIVGMQRAKELIWTARKINADEAWKMGIANKVVAPEDLETKVMELAGQLAAGPAFAIGLSKTLLFRSMESTLQDMLQYEAMAQAICLQSEDNKEGIKSFREKRKPVFRGK
jgi:2-(1,2-epoxy-1,2-dihydrophenyl)acetyl-CoA isomerase